MATQKHFFNMPRVMIQNGADSDFRGLFLIPTKCTSANGRERNAGELVFLGNRQTVRVAGRQFRTPPSMLINLLLVPNRPQRMDDVPGGQVIAAVSKNPATN